MDTYIFLIIFIFIVLPLSITLKFMDLGFLPKEAIRTTINLPKDSFYILRIFYQYCIHNNKGYQGRVYFIKKITNTIICLPSSLVQYADMRLTSIAKYAGIKEIVTTLSNEDLIKLQKILIDTEDIKINSINSRGENDIVAICGDLELNKKRYIKNLFINTLNKKYIKS